KTIIFFLSSRRRHTRLQGDWSSDVCSSDLLGEQPLEAGEYLERLDGLLDQSNQPGTDELVRLARALRGSALMANQQAIARAAAGLESLARAVHDGRRSWDAQTKQLAVRAVDDLKIFVRRAGAWTD